MKCEYCDNEVPMGATRCPSCGATPSQQQAIIATTMHPTTMCAPETETEKDGQGESFMFCCGCGAKVSKRAKQCPKCGEPFANGLKSIERKDRSVFVLLGIFLGLFGIHDFYAGYIWRGVVQLVCTTLLGWLIIPLFIDMIFILIELCVTTKDAQGVDFS